MADDDLKRLHDRIDHLAMNMQNGFDELKTAIVGDTTGTITGLRQQVAQNRDELKATKATLDAVQTADTKRLMKAAGWSGVGGAGIGGLIVKFHAILDLFRG